MKKLTAFLSALMFCACCYAQSYSYLAFEKSDGTKFTVGVDQLEMVFVDGKLQMTNADGTQEVSVADLTKMFFTDKAEEAQTPDGINEIGMSGNGVQVYSLSGTSLGHFCSSDAARQQLAKGVYVIRENGRTFKIAVR